MGGTSSVDIWGIDEDFIRDRQTEKDTICLLAKAILVRDTDPRLAHAIALRVISLASPVTKEKMNRIIFRIEKEDLGR